MFNIPHNPMLDFNYTPITTFWDDFSIADPFGEKAIRGTFRRGFAYAKKDYKYLTEFVMVLNHKLWQHYNNGNIMISRIYDELWKQADNFAQTHLKGEKLDYFYTTTD